MIQIDIDMPTCCAECPCLLHDKNVYQCGITLGMRTHIDKKPLWCPLIDTADDGK